MKLTLNPPKIIGNHLITGICITCIEDLDNIIKTHGSIALKSHGYNIYGASIVKNWNFGIVTKYIQEEYMFVTINIKNIVKQDSIKRKYYKKVIIKEPLCLVRFNPLYDEHIKQNTKILNK